MIEVKHLDKSFGDLHILKDISTNIEKGEKVVIIGPSGSGKSTFLRCLNRLEQPSGGQILFEGEDLTHMPDRQLYAVRQKMGMVFQSFNLFRNKTVVENVMTGLIYGKGMKKKDAYEIAMTELEKVHMDSYKDMYPAELSGGMQQRVGIARALAPQPEVILFDEPTSALDPELVGEVLDTISDIAGRGITMIIVTHEMNFAKDISSRVLFMNAGYVVEEGSPKEIFYHPRQEETRLFLRRMIHREPEFAV